MASTFHRVEIRVDGVEAARLAAGEVAHLEVGPGPHRLRARVGPTESNELRFTAGDEPLAVLVDSDTVLDPFPVSRPRGRVLRLTALLVEPLAP